METYNWVVILSIHDESVVENVPVDLAWVRDVLRQRDDLFIGRVYANINIAHVLKIVVIHNRHHIDAIDAMELAGGRSSPIDSPFASTSCASLSQPVAAYALLPTPLRQEIGKTEAHNLALAAIANALASEQLDRVQPHPAEPHSPTHHRDPIYPDPIAEDPHVPQSSLANGGPSVTTLDDTVF